MFKHSHGYVPDCHAIAFTGSVHSVWFKLRMLITTHNRVVVRFDLPRGTCQHTHPTYRVVVTVIAGRRRYVQTRYADNKDGYQLTDIYGTPEKGIHILDQS